jgi:hypothetical protein
LGSQVYHYISSNVNFFPTIYSSPCSSYNIDWLTNKNWLTHSMVEDILWKVVNYTACQKVACFITVFIESHHWTLFWASCTQFIPIDPYGHKVHLNVILPPMPSSSQPKPREQLSPLPCVLHVFLTASS